MSFYVYYLLNPRDGEILYIGRSTHPKRRLSAFERREQRSAILGLSQRFRDFESAAQAERSAIEKYRPPFNKLTASAKGRTGIPNSPERRAQISSMHKGKPLSSDVKERIRRALMGRPPTIGNTRQPLPESAKQKLRGRHISQETRQRMSLAAKNRRKK